MPIPEVVRLSLEHAQALQYRVESVTNAMANQWLNVGYNIDKKASQVAKEIVALQAQGKEVTEAWLNELKYYKALSEQAQNQISSYMGWAERYTQQEVINAALLGIDNASDMYLYTTQGIGYFKGLPAPQIESIAAITARDAPLGQLFEQIRPTFIGMNPITESLMSGLAMGMPMTEIAKLITDAANVPYKRSVLIARTEVNRAHRSATLRTYQEYEVPYYRRLASRGHACFACMMLDGMLYTSKEALDDHPNGACQMVPVLDPDSKSTDWEHGKERFEKMSEAEQRKIMGNNYFDAWKRGDFTLDQMVVVRQNPVWGGSPGVRPLKELSPNWRQHTATGTPTTTEIATLSPAERERILKRIEEVKPANYSEYEAQEKLLRTNRYSINKLTDEEIESFYLYSSTHYEEINQALWANQPLTGEYQSVADNLRTGIAKAAATDGDVVAVRGMRDWNPNLQVGDKYIDNAFMSTTINGTTGAFDGHRLEIFIPRGSKDALYISDLARAPEEHELLFNVNSMFEVVGREYYIGNFNEQFTIYKLIYLGNAGL